MRCTLIVYFFCLLLIGKSWSQTTKQGNSKIEQPRLFAEGIISTGDYETHPAFSPSGDTVYFLKCSPDLNQCAIYISIRQQDIWTAPMITSFSGKYLDVDPFVTGDGKWLYFVSNRPLTDGEPAKEEWDIWKTEITKTGWGAPIHLPPPVNSPESEYYPTISDQGTLYFGSSRPGGKGGSDIYRSRLEDGQYKTVENLGDSINTADNEYEAFIAPDEKYLIFMATIPRGIANADFYLSYSNGKGWTKAKKIASPINSSYTEWSPKVTRDGKYFFFGSTRNRNDLKFPRQQDLSGWENMIRSPGNGLGDIYYINFSAIKIDSSALK